MPFSRTYCWGQDGRGHDKYRLWWGCIIRGRKNTAIVGKNGWGRTSFEWRKNNDGNYERGCLGSDVLLRSEKKKMRPFSSLSLLIVKVFFVDLEAAYSRLQRKKFLIDWSNLIRQFNIGWELLIWKNLSRAFCRKGCVSNWLENV